MKKRITSVFLGLIFAAASITMILPATTNASPGIIEYQIGTKVEGPDEWSWEIEYWSNWSEDGDEAVVRYEDMSWPGYIATKVSAPGYHVEYQIGTKLVGSDEWSWDFEYWSDWAEDGDEAVVRYEDMSWPGFIALRIIAPGYHVEYQIGTKVVGSDEWSWDLEYWSDWAEDGDEAVVRYESMSWPGFISMRAIMTVPLGASIDIGPDTLNLKSKGNWITSDIIPPEGYNAEDIEIDTMLLNDVIPAEWGDVQGEELMVKFDRSEVEDMLSPGTCNLKVSGELTDGSAFEGYSDEIRIIDPS
jgi:hypothetical protein